MSFRRSGPHPDELLSASLTGDLTDAERAELNAHLTSCSVCRETLAAFAEQRRLVSAMHEVPRPRDLGARVRTRIASGRSGAGPWWRNPGALVGIGASLATVTAAILAFVVIRNLPLDLAGHSGSPSATGSTSANATASILPSPASASPAQSEAPVVASLPISRFRYTLANGVPSLVQVTDGVDQPVTAVMAAPPVAASLSSDQRWVSLRVEGELVEEAETYAASGGEVFSLGRTKSPSAAFGNELAWSSDGHYLAFTLVSPDGGSSDVWLFDVASQETHQLTNTGDAFAGSWMPGDGNQLLWVSRAAATPNSYLVSIASDVGLPGPIDPANAPVQAEEGVFLPLVSPDGSNVIFWRGSMARGDGRWTFQSGGLPYLGQAAGTGQLDFSGTSLFPDLTPTGGEAFTSARIAWGPNSDAFAVWNAAWTGLGQPEGFPDPTRVYFGHVTNGELITQRQELDPGDLDGILRVVDVAIAEDGVSLAITGLTGAGSEGGTFGPEADLRIVLRGYGNDADTVTTLGEAGAWNGPALYPPCCASAP
jgi:anti-sigma factor RsiW